MTDLTNAEQRRLDEDRARAVHWKRWGPYVSDRAWGTVREDYSPTGTAWESFPHDHARSRAYRWGEDGLGGICDRHQYTCFALALWNGNDAILKERLFGLTGNEGNHGEDVKEYYFYLDSTPTHSYMRMLYKYPQAAFPYESLADENRRRGRDQPEFELVDTGVFNEDRYFDVYVEYAKGGAEDILVKITAYNRGPEAAELRLLPTLWFRNDWAAWITESNRAAGKPDLSQIKAAAGTSAVKATHSLLGEFILSCEGEVPLLFTENSTNYERLFPGQPNVAPYVKDGINDFVVLGRQGTVNPGKTGTKVAAHYRLTVGSGQSATVRLRLTKTPPQSPPCQGGKLGGWAAPKRQSWSARHRSGSPAQARMPRVSRPASPQSWSCRGCRPPPLPSVPRGRSRAAIAGRKHRAGPDRGSPPSAGCRG